MAWTYKTNRTLKSPSALEAVTSYCNFILTVSTPGLAASENSPYSVVRKCSGTSQKWWRNTLLIRWRLNMALRWIRHSYSGLLCLALACCLTLVASGKIAVFYFAQQQNPSDASDQLICFTSISNCASQQIFTALIIFNTSQEMIFLLQIFTAYAMILRCMCVCVAMATWRCRHDGKPLMTRPETGWRQLSASGV